MTLPDFCPACGFDKFILEENVLVCASCGKVQNEERPEKEE